MALGVAAIVASIVGGGTLVVLELPAPAFGLLDEPLQPTANIATSSVTRYIIFIIYLIKWQKPLVCKLTASLPLLHMVDELEIPTTPKQSNYKQDYCNDNEKVNQTSSRWEGQEAHYPEDEEDEYECFK